MGSSACRLREFMKLFKCVLHTGIDVLSAFFTLKVLTLKKIGGSFTKFLDHEKHFFIISGNKGKPCAVHVYTSGVLLGDLLK